MLGLLVLAFLCGPAVFFAACWLKLRYVLCWVHSTGRNCFGFSVGVHRRPVCLILNGLWAERRLPNASTEIKPTPVRLLTKLESYWRSDFPSAIQQPSATAICLRQCRESHAKQVPLAVDRQATQACQKRRYVKPCKSQMIQKVTRG
jgi:hypothetical protein